MPGLANITGYRSKGLLFASWQLLSFITCISQTSRLTMAFADEVNPLAISLLLRLEEDNGQAWGSLWEATDAEGRVIAGAGFQNAYNTQDRSDRRVLQVFVRTQSRPDFNTNLLPRPTSDSGTYLYGFNGQLFSYGRNAIDKGLKRWDSKTNEWLIDSESIPFSVDVAGKPLAVTDNSILYGQQVLHELSQGDGKRFGEWYYASGLFVVREFSHDSADAMNELVAFSWTPGRSVDYKKGIRQPLSKWGEFIYCFGQNNGIGSESCLVSASNLGCIYCFQDARWRAVRESDGKSFQIYSSINYREKLLFGQYPSGELFQWSNSGLIHRPDQPPVMQGVSSNAREAQTLAIYGGELHVGVWPWGEVWRQNAWNNQWEFLGRLFTHPDPTDKWTHPYEPETKALDPVLNRWGQRITSMVPFEDSLIISTSAKGPNPYEEKFTFLGKGKHLEYGAVHKYTTPGCLSVPITWTGKPVRLDFLIRPNSIDVRQDGKRIGFTNWDESYPAMLESRSTKIGTGTFGPFREGSLSRIDPPESVTVHDEIRGAYLHVSRHISPASDPGTWSEAIGRECADMKEFGLTALMPFVSDSSGRAHFASQHLPRLYEAADPIGVLATELRARGIEYHPVIPVAICGGDEPKGVLLEHPEWALRTPDGKPMGYFSPANPEARQWLVNYVREVTSMHNPDGVLFDYLRYANRPHRLDDASEKRFLATLPPDCSPDEQQRLFQAFKEAELTVLVRQLSEVVRKNLTGKPIAAYVWGPHVAMNHQIAQVWPEWISAGYLDHINVSGYCYKKNYGSQYLQKFHERIATSYELNASLAKPARMSFALGLLTSHGAVNSADEIREYESVGSFMDGEIYFTWEYLKPFLGELKNSIESPMKSK